MEEAGRKAEEERFFFFASGRNVNVVTKQQQFMTEFSTFFKALCRTWKEAGKVGCWYLRVELTKHGRYFISS